MKRLPNGTRCDIYHRVSNQLSSKGEMVSHILFEVVQSYESQSSQVLGEWEIDKLTLYLLARVVSNHSKSRRKMNPVYRTLCQCVCIFKSVKL